MAGVIRDFPVNLSNVGEEDYLFVAVMKRIVELRGLVNHHPVPFRMCQGLFLCCLYYCTFFALCADFGTRCIKNGTKCKKATVLPGGKDLSSLGQKQPLLFVCLKCHGMRGGMRVVRRGGAAAVLCREGEKFIRNYHSAVYLLILSL